VAVSDFALISNRFLQVVVAAPGHGCREIGLWREIIDCVEKNLQTSYRAPPFIFFLSSVELQLAHKTDTVPSYHIMTQSSRPRKHMIALGRCAATTLLAATGERTRKQEQYRKRRRTRKHNQKETTYVRRQAKGRTSSNGNRGTTRGHNQGETYT